MWRISQRSRGYAVYPTALAFLGIEFNLQDDVGSSPTAKKLKQELRLEYTPLTGWEGLKRMWTLQEPNGISLELLSCVQLGLCTSFMGFIIGGIDNTKTTVRDFKEQNQATMYQNTFEAQRAVSDRVAREFFKGGMRTAIKFGSFLFSFCLFTTSISTYRGKTSISDYALGGFFTGAVFTLNRGLSGALSGGILGTVLGTVTGTALVGALWLFGIDINHVRQWQYLQYQRRVDAENKGYLKERERDNKPEEKVAFAIIKPEEKEKGRIIDQLDNLVKNPVVSDVVVPEHPPESMFRKDEKK